MCAVQQGTRVAMHTATRAVTNSSCPFGWQKEAHYANSWIWWTVVARIPGKPLHAPDDSSSIRNKQRNCLYPSGTLCYQQSLVIWYCISPLWEQSRDGELIQLMLEHFRGYSIVHVFPSLVSWTEDHAFSPIITKWSEFWLQILHWREIFT
jgi:hypothetical protein